VEYVYDYLSRIPERFSSVDFYVMKNLLNTNVNFKMIDKREIQDKVDEYMEKSNSVTLIQLFMSVGRLLNKKIDEYVSMKDLNDSVNDVRNMALIGLLKGIKRYITEPAGEFYTCAERYIDLELDRNCKCIKEKKEKEEIYIKNQKVDVVESKEVVRDTKKQSGLLVIVVASVMLLKKVIEQLRKRKSRNKNIQIVCNDKNVERTQEVVKTLDSNVADNITFLSNVQTEIGEEKDNDKQDSIEA